SCTSDALKDTDSCNEICAIDIAVGFCGCGVELRFQFSHRSVPTDLRNTRSEFFREDECLQKSHGYRGAEGITRAEIRRAAKIVGVRHYDERDVLLGHL